MTGARRPARPTTAAKVATAGTVIAAVHLRRHAHRPSASIPSSSRIRSNNHRHPRTTTSLASRGPAAVLALPADSGVLMTASKKAVMTTCSSIYPLSPPPRPAPRCVTPSWTLAFLLPLTKACLGVECWSHETAKPLPSSRATFTGARTTQRWARVLRRRGLWTRPSVRSWMASTSSPAPPALTSKGSCRPLKTTPSAPWPTTAGLRTVFSSRGTLSCGCPPALWVVSSWPGCPSTSSCTRARKKSGFTSPPFPLPGASSPCMRREPWSCGC